MHSDESVCIKETVEKVPNDLEVWKFVFQVPNSSWWCISCGHFLCTRCPQWPKHAASQKSLARMPLYRHSSSPWPPQASERVIRLAGRTATMTAASNSRLMICSLIQPVSWNCCCHLLTNLAKASMLLLGPWRFSKLVPPLSYFLGKQGQLISKLVILCANLSRMKQKTRLLSP